MLPGEIIAAVPLAQLIALAVPLSLIDIQLKRLPNIFTLPALASAQLSTLIASATDSSWGRYLWSIATLLLIACLGFAAARSGALGMGDVKLMSASTPVLAWFDPFAALVSLVVAFVAASAVVTAAALSGIISWSARVALGPYLLTGTVMASALIWGRAFGA